jgi:tetratricopeptide (TPR) repeat protein
VGNTLIDKATGTRHYKGRSGKGGRAVTRERRGPPWLRTSEGLEQLAKVAAGVAALLAPGLVVAVLGQMGLGQLTRVIGLVLTLLGLAGGAAALGFTVAAGVATRRAAKEEALQQLVAAERERRERLLVPICSVGRVNPHEIGVDLEQVQLQLQPGQDPYLQRDRDEDLRRALDETLLNGKPRLVMLLGPSKAGKSRTLLEAVLRHPKLGTATLIAPRREAEALTWLLEQGHLPTLGQGPVLLWLNDLEYFMHPGDKGMHRGVLGDLEKWEQQVVVLATAGGKGAALLTDSKLSTPFNDLLRSVRPRLWLSSDLSEEELSRALASYGAGQVEQIKQHGIGEFLVAAPELEHKLATERHPGDMESCPEGAAVVWAAADWARAGMLRPVPEETLRDLWRNYVGMTPSAEERFQRGVAWALRPIYRSSSLLRGERGGYHPYEPIVAYVDRQRKINPAAWARITELASQEEAFQVGVVAYNLGNVDRAERAMQRAGEAEDPEVAATALSNLGILLQQQGDLEGAEAAYRRADEHGHADAAFNLAILLQQHDDLEGAEAAYRRADARGHAEAAFILGMLLHERGDLEGAEVAYRRTDEGGHAKAAFSLGALLQQRGDLEGAEAAYRRAEERGHTGATFMLGMLLQEHDQLEGAEAAFRRADELSRLPGTTDLDALSAGTLLRQRGDLEGAEAAYRRADKLSRLRGATELTAVEVTRLRGAAELDAFITTRGDNAAYDDEVRGLASQANLLALGTEGTGAALLLHCDVPFGGEMISTLLVFTRMEYVAAAVRMNPSWGSLNVLPMYGRMVMGDLGEGEWLGINMWSGHEFKLPPAAATASHAGLRLPFVTIRASHLLFERQPRKIDQFTLGAALEPNESPENCDTSLTPG